MVPNEFATLLEMTLYKLVGNNLIPKTFVNNDFWRKLRTKFTNAGQYAKTSSSRPRKTTTPKHSKPPKPPKPSKPEKVNKTAKAAKEAGPAVPHKTEEEGTEQLPATPNSTPVRKILPSNKKKKQNYYSIPRDRPS